MMAADVLDSTMKQTLIFTKTEQGKKEVTQRAHKLDNQQRMLLIMVDGKKTVADMAKQLAAFGDISSALETLVEAGLIAVSGEADSSASVSANTRAAAETLAKAGFIAKKTQASMPTRQAPASGALPQTANGFDLNDKKQRIKTLLESNFGPMAGPMISRLNTCANQEQFIDYLADCRQLISEALNESKADQFWGGVLDIMGDLT